MLMTPLFSEELTLKIGKEQYVKQMPEKQEDLKALVRQLTGMYNDLNDTHNKQSETTAAKIDEITIELTTAKADLIAAKNNNELIINSLSTSKTDIINEIKGLDTSTKRFSLGASIKSSLSFDAFDMSLLGLFNITKSFYTGASIGIYTSPKDEVIKPMIGVYLGSWIF
jgi:hypothetical protein